MTGQEHYIEQLEERLRRLEIVTGLAVCPECHSRSAGSYVYVALRIPLIDCFYLADAMREEDLTLDEACYIAGHWEAA